MSHPFPLLVVALPTRAGSRRLTSEAAANAKGSRVPKSAALAASDPTLDQLQRNGREHACTAWATHPANPFPSARAPAASGMLQAQPLSMPLLLRSHAMQTQNCLAADRTSRTAGRRLTK